MEDARKVGESVVYTFDFCTRLQVKNDRITQVELVYLINNTPYYLKGLDSSSYSRYRDIMYNSFGADKCSGDTCRNDKFRLSIYNDGNIDIFSNNDDWSCNINRQVGTNSEIHCTVPF